MNKVEITEERYQELLANEQRLLFLLGDLGLEVGESGEFQKNPKRVTLMNEAFSTIDLLYAQVKSAKFKGEQR